MSDEEKRTRIEVDLNQEMPEHVMPNGVMVIEDDDGGLSMQCVVNLSVETPERVTDHIVEILDTFAGNFTQTEHSGRVKLLMWNDNIPDDACAVVEQVISGTLNKLQAFADSNQFTSADGHPLQFSYAFANKFPPEFDD